MIDLTLKKIIKKGHSNIVRQYIEEHDVDLSIKDAEGWGYLHFAAYSDNSEIIQLLIDKGIDVNTTSITNLTSPLLIAIYEVKALSVKALVENNAPIGKGKISGQKPLHYILYNNLIDIAEIMLLSGKEEYLNGESKPDIAKEIATYMKHYPNNVSRWNKLLNILNGTSYGRKR